MAVGVEAHAEALELATARRAPRARGSRRRCAPHEAAAGALGVRAVQLGRVVVGERGGDPALRPVAGGLRQRAWRTRARRAPPARGRGQRGVEAGAAGADDGDVGLRTRGVGVGAAMAGYRTAVAAPGPAPPPGVARARHAARHPERVAAHRGDRARRSTPRGWLGCDVRTAPAATREQLDGGPRPGLRAGASRRCCARGRRPARRRHRRLEGSCEAALHARRRRRSALVDALLGRRGASVGAALHRPPGHHAEPTRAMGFCLFNNVAVARAPRARRPRLRAGARSSTGTCTTATARTTSSTRPDASSSSRSTSRRCTRARARRATSARARARATRSTCPCPAARATRRSCSLVEHASCRSAAPTSPQLVLVSAGFDAHRDDPLAGCAVTDAGFATMAGSAPAPGRGARGAARRRCSRAATTSGRSARSLVATLEA